MSSTSRSIRREIVLHVLKSNGHKRKAVLPALRQIKSWKQGKANGKENVESTG